MDAEHLLIDLTHGRIMDQPHIVEQKIEIKSEKARKRCRRAHADDINGLGLEDRIDRAVEVFFAHLVDRAAELVHIRGEHGVENVAAVDLFLSDLNALHRRETVADHLLHGAPHPRYPSYPSSVAKRTTVDSETPTVCPSFPAVIKAALS